MEHDRSSGEGAQGSDLSRLGDALGPRQSIFVRFKDHISRHPTALISSGELPRTTGTRTQIAEILPWIASGHMRIFVKKTTLRTDIDWNTSAK